MKNKKKKTKKKTKRALSKGISKSLDARRANVSELGSKSIRVFLYGTMKRNFYNYNAYLSCACGRGQARFLHDAITKDPFRLILWGSRHVPAMVENSDENNNNNDILPQIHGEVFLVDKNTLAGLDDFFEDGEVRYTRKPIRIIKSSASSSSLRQRRDVHAYAYVVTPTTEFLNLPTLAEYTEMEHEKYSNPTFQPKVFELMTGVDKEYFSLFWDPKTHHGRRFDNVWREALGEPLLTDRCRIKLSDFYLGHIPETQWGIFMWKSFGWFVYFIAPFSILITFTNIAAGMYYGKKYGEIIDVAVVDTVDVMVPNTLMAICIDYCFYFLKFSTGIAYAQFFTWCVIETIFWFYMQYTLNYYEKQHLLKIEKDDKKNDDHLSLEDVEKIKNERYRQFHSVAELEFRSKERGKEYLCQWFLGAKSFKDVYEDNLKDFYTFAYFGKSSVRHLNNDENSQLLEFVQITKSYLGGLSHGRNENIKSIRPKYDPLLAEHHPFVFYFLTEGLIQILYSFVTLSSLGFKGYSAGNVRYWYHPGPNNTNNNNSTKRKSSRKNSKNDHAMPIILFPGVGVGLLSYEKVFKALALERPVIVYEVPCVSLRVIRGFSFYTVDDILQSIDIIRDRHVEYGPLQKIHFVGHSFGSGIASIIIKHYEPKRDIGNVTLIDAMPFCLHRAGLSRNFLYDPYEDGRVYLVNREPHLAFTLMRQLDWKAFILWPEDLNVLSNPATIILSGSDALVPSAKIKAQLAEAGHDGIAKTNLVWLSDCDHGDFLFDNVLAQNVTKHILNPVVNEKYFGMHYTLVTREEMRKRFVKHKRRRKALGLL